METNVRRRAVRLATGIFIFALAAQALGAQLMFRPPVQVASTLVVNQHDNTAPSLFNDDRTMYFSSDRPGPGNKSIWEVTRASISAPWTGLREISALNSPTGDFSLDVTDDGLQLFLTSLRSGGKGGTDLWHFTRANTSQTWGTPTNMPFNTATDECDPSVRRDGLEIFWVALEPITTTISKTYSIYRATRPNAASTVWTNHGPISELNLFPWIDHSPAISPDGLTMIFATDRRGGTGSSDMYLATRQSLTSPFSIVGELTELNTPTWEKNGQWSTDGFSFYYTRDNNKDIWRADQIRAVVAFKGVLQRGLIRNVTLGSSFSAFVRRDPGDTGILAVSYGLIAPITLPGALGTLDIDLGRLLLPPSTGPLDANGRRTLNFTVPNVPSLRGLTLYFQGASRDSTTVIFMSASHAIQII